MLRNSADSLARTFQFRRAKSSDEPKRSNVLLMARIQAIKICPSYSHAACFTLFVWELSTLTKDNFAAKTDLAVSSTEYCQYKFDEPKISIRLGGGHIWKCIFAHDTPDSEQVAPSTECYLVPKQTQESFSEWAWN